MLHFHAHVQSPAGQMPLSVNFDRAYTALAKLPRLFIELDGSFVWTGQEAGAAWQVDGNLIDQGSSLAYAELKGCCPPARLDELLAALGSPPNSLAFHLPHRGLTLDEAAFRTLAASERGAL